MNVIITMTVIYSMHYYRGNNKFPFPWLLHVSLHAFITDTTPEKIGKFTPGTHIPIISHNHFLKKEPDVAVLFAWNHKVEILKKEKKFKLKGGKWLTFFPDIKIW